MGAKDYDFADMLPEYRDNSKVSFESKSREKTRKRRATPKSKALPGGIRQRRNKHMKW
jgi:hypothetical protein